MTGKAVIFIAALAVLAAGANPALAGEDTPCVELRLKGGYEITIPCPEGLDEVLSLFQPGKRSGEDRNFVIDPKWPHDQAMSADQDWPYDSAMIVPQADESENAPPPKLDDALENLLSWLGQGFNDLASLPEQDSLDPWEPNLEFQRYINEGKWQRPPVNPPPPLP